jgi:hypothetical protein
MSFYFGEIKQGTPYFLPRRLVKGDNPGYSKFVERKFGFDIVGLGWKTKWESIRHEWNPMISFVCFNRQFCVWFGLPKVGDHFFNDYYWEAWITYNIRTDKSKSKEERLKEVFEQYTCTWGNTSIGYMDHYPFFLKKKYLKVREQWKNARVK